MRKILIVPVSALLLLLGVAGCQQKGIGITRYDKGTSPNLQLATADGEYFLYQGSKQDPQASYALKQGDPLGFKTGTTGHIIAVAGTHEIDVLDDNWVWKRNDPTAESKK